MYDIRPVLMRLKSRKFLLAVFNVIFIIINEGLQQPIDVEAYKYITSAIIAFIVGESYIDAKK